MKPTMTLLPRTGLVAGRHSLAETRELLAVADYRFNEVEQALTESRAVDGVPGLVRAELDGDWAKLLGRWVEARRAIVRALTLKAAAFPLLTADSIPTEDEWLRTLSFTQGQELVKGSLQDVTRRTEGILKRPILFANEPRQNAPDLDLDLFQELDRQIKATKGALVQAEADAHKALTNRTVLAVGGTLAVLALASVFWPEIGLGLAALGRRRKKR